MSSPLVRKGDILRRPVFSTWEKTKNKPQVHWVAELLAEAFGVFFYVYAGASATASYVVGNIVEVQGLGSVLQIGFAYACGILFAVGCCTATSGGHFGPSITLIQVLFNGFPPIKGLRYVAAQLFGSYIACALVYNQWKPFIDAAEGVLIKAGTFEAVMFTPNGPAGIFGLYLPAGQTLARVFLNEAVNSFFVGFIIWASIDPSNLLITPQIAPFIISLAYAVAIWGSAAPGVALNTARDLGGRFWAMTVWGTAASGGKYAAIAALTNLPMTVFAVVVYETFFSDSRRVISQGTLDYLRGAGYAPQEDTRSHSQESVLEANTGPIGHSQGDSSEEKPSIKTVENTHPVTNYK